MHLCLGTVQFGMDYGIRGQKMPKIEDAISWLDYATQNGITAIDTARAYGTAEVVLGDFLAQMTIPRESLFISTKLCPNILDEYKPEKYEYIIERELKNQLKTLHTDYVDAYLFHSARYAFDEGKLKAMAEMKKKGLARKVGVSVYEPEEAYACFRSPFLDFVQMPYSIFDQRMRDAGVFASQDRYGVEIHTRSAFIQGLITMGESEVPQYLERAKPIIRRVDDICRREGISRVALALQFVKREKAISHLVFGVDSLEQLKEDIDLFNADLDDELLETIGREFEGMDADIVMPSLWKK